MVDGGSVCEKKMSQEDEESEDFGVPCLPWEFFCVVEIAEDQKWRNAL